jgi:hypothetical protein
MKHGRPDYEQIQDPSGKIPVDEPVFLIRAQDVLAVETLQHYRTLAILTMGINDPLIAHIQEIIKTFEAWPKKKNPDVPKS